MSSLEELTTPGAATRSMILPHILRFTAASPPPEQPREVVVLVNSRDNSVTFIEGTYNADVEIFNDEGPLPASKASIESMPVVRVLDQGTECAICLSEFKVGGEAKLMPCEHRFHENCAEKWLRINGSCPVCRYQVAVDDEESENEKVDYSDEVMFVYHVVFSSSESMEVHRVRSGSMAELDVHGVSDYDYVTPDNYNYGDSEYNYVSSNSMALDGDSDYYYVNTGDGDDESISEDMVMDDN